MNVSRAFRRTAQHAFSVRVLLVLGYAALAVLLFRGLRLPDRPPGHGLSGEIRRAMEAQQPDTVPVLLFVFNPADCPSCLELGERLNAFHLSGAARVRGIAVHGSTADSSPGRPAGAARFGYPVMRSPSPELLAGLVQAGHDTTPIVVLTDARYRLSLIVPPLRDPATHAGAIQLLARQLLHTRQIRASRRRSQQARGTPGPWDTQSIFPSRLRRSLR